MKVYRLFIVLISLLVLSPFYGFSSCCFPWCKGSKTDAHLPETKLKQAAWVEKVLTSHFKKDLDKLVSLDMFLRTPWGRFVASRKEYYDVLKVFMGGKDLNPDVIKAIQYSFTIFDQYVPLSMFADASLQRFDNDYDMVEYVKKLFPVTLPISSSASVYSKKN